MTVEGAAQPQAPPGRKQAKGRGGGSTRADPREPQKPAIQKARCQASFAVGAVRVPGEEKYHPSQRSAAMSRAAVWALRVWPWAA